MKTTKLLMCAVAFTTAFAATKAQGQNITATLNGISPGLTVRGTFNDGNFIWDYPSGLMNFTSPDTTDPDFGTFCIEPLQDLSYGQTLVYQLQNVITLANVDAISRLVSGFLESSQSDADAAAVQWAIWETTTESSATQSLLNGNVRVIGAAALSTATLANQYLANINTFDPVTLTYLHNDTFQDTVALVQLTVTQVPEPASAGLAALSCLLLLRRRRA